MAMVDIVAHLLKVVAQPRCREDIKPILRNAAQYASKLHLLESVTKQSHDPRFVLLCSTMLFVILLENF